MEKKMNLAIPSKKTDHRGFTLIELMIVIVILGILAGLLVPRIMGRPDEARQLKAKILIEGMETALKQMTLNKPTANSRGLRFGNFVQMRAIMYDTLEAIFAGDKTAQEGLDDAAKKGNRLLRKFEKANK